MSTPRIVTLGETMARVDTSGPVPLPHAATASLGIGGAESNVAIGVRRLGIAATWVGRVGDDPFGDLVGRELRAEGVNAVVRRDPEAPTGLMVKEHRSSSTTRVWYYRTGSAGSRIEPRDLDGVDLASASVLHVTGITPGLSDSAATTVAVAVERACGAGVPVSLDVNYRARVWGDRDAGAALRPIAASAEIVFGGPEELALLVGDVPPDEQVAAVAALGPRQVIAKLGADGCVAWIDGQIFVVPAIPAAVVDTVGAGDAFVAGYLAEFVLGKSPAHRLATAVRAGAMLCEALGDWEGAPTRAELDHARDGDPVAR
jgi:2-dehydro-3-deoxygluconokinase